MKTAIIYARVSTSRQADEGISIESQIEQAERKAAELGVKVLRVYRDDGISGRTANRPAFQSAITFCGAYDVDYFLCWNTSRFARNKIDAASHKKLLESGGTKVVYVSVNIDSETDEGWFSESIFEIMDEHYSRQVSRDTRRSMLKNARDGYWNGGHVPYGYEAVAVDGKRKRLQVVEHEASTVREMFNRYLGGDGCKLIAMNLNERGITYRGRPWSKNQVNSMLKNPVYAGFVVFNRQDKQKRDKPESEWIMTKSHEPIVNEADAARVRELFHYRSPDGDGGSPHSQFVFTGILRCGECGAAMQTETATGRAKLYHYYNCSKAQKGAGCRNRRISAPEFDTWMVDTVLGQVLTPARMRDVMKEIAELTNSWQDEHLRRREAVLREIKEATRRRANLFDVLELHGKDAPHLGDLAGRIRELNTQIKTLEDDLARIDNEAAPEIQVTDEEINLATAAMARVVRNTDKPAKLRALMGSFIGHIMLNTADVSMEYRPDRVLGKKKRHDHSVRSVDSWLPELGSNQRPAD